MFPKMGNIQSSLNQILESSALLQFLMFKYNYQKKKNFSFRHFCSYVTECLCLCVSEIFVREFSTERDATRRLVSVFII